MFVAVERNQPALVETGNARNIKAMNRVEKEQRPHAFIQVLAAAPKCVQCRAFREQLFQRRAPAHGVERLIPHRRVGRGHDLHQPAVHFTPLKASSSTRPLNTSSRSWPSSASASCAVSSPYFNPIS